MKIAGKFPLTHPQKRIWYTEIIYPDTSLHNIGGTIRFNGLINRLLLEEALHIFIQKNEGLRLQLCVDAADENETVRQYVNELKVVKIDFFDFSLKSNPQAEFEIWAKDEFQKPFSLLDSPLYYFALFKLDEKAQGYLVRFHHLIADGWSINIMTEQIGEIYCKLSQEEAINPGVGYSYLEYIEQEQKYLTSERFLKDKAFWTDKFHDLPELSLHQSNSDSTIGARKTYHLAESRSILIKDFMRLHKYSLNTFLVTVFLIYLSKTSGQNDLVIGTPVLNRSGKKEKAMVGMFTSTMPFRFKVTADIPIRSLMADVEHELRECYFHQKYPYDLLVQDLELKKKGYDKLFNLCVNYYNTKLNTDLMGVPIENLEFHNGHQIYALQLVIKDWSDFGCLTWDFDYKLSDYTDIRIEQMYRHLNALIDQILEGPDQTINVLQIISTQEKIWLLEEFNATEADYPSQKTIIQLFEEQVNHTPQRIALYFQNQSLTYQSLNEKANQLAHRLRELGAGRDTIIGLMAAHSLEMVIGLWGVLKAGGAYLPIDPDYPAERILFMLHDAMCPILLSNVAHSEAINFNGQVIDLNDPGLSGKDTVNPPLLNEPHDLVYVIYTSGSTGQPKGVMIEHRGLVNYIWWAKQMYLQDENEVVALYSSLAFDLTVTSIYMPLISGNRIIIYEDDETEFVLFKIMRENKVNVIKLTPAHLSLLKDQDHRDSVVKRFIVGGEDLKVNLAKAIFHCFGGKVDIYNEYGPTETVVGCMIHKYDFIGDTGSSVPIGIPAANTQIYVLDRDLNPLPVESPGEMYISGAGVARGYLNRQELTAEKFIPNPYSITNEQYSVDSLRLNNLELRTQNSQLMYKTGDLAKFLSNGKIEYLGRVDHQVKLRGYRIELGEIEKQILQFEGIKEAVVIDREDATGSKYLCAYLVGVEELAIPALKKQLGQSLPDYMIPRHFVSLTQLPLTFNGKVDRKLLPEPLLNHSETSIYQASRNEKEALLCKTVLETLSIEKAGINDNFYHLGGDSIKAIQIASKLNEKGFALKVKDILSHPTLGEMSDYIESVQKTAVSSEPVAGDIDITPVIGWFWEQKFLNPHHWNQSVLLNLKQDITPENMELILNQLTVHHDALRINYNPQTERLFYNNLHLQRQNKVHCHDLSALGALEQQRKIAAIGGEIKSSWNIEKDLLIKACIFDLGHNGKRLFLTAHHLVVDGVSWRIIIEDLANFFEKIRTQTVDAFMLPSKTHSYQSWAIALTDYAKDKVLAEKEYWDAVITSGFHFPADFDTVDITMANVVKITRELDITETKQLLSSANTAYNTNTEELLVITLALTICAHTSQTEMMMELEGHGREELFEQIDISRTVGWFTSIYPQKLKVIPADLSLQLKSLKEQLRVAPNKGLGFGILKYLNSAQSKSLRINQYQTRHQIRFNYLGEVDNRFPKDVFELATEDTGPECGTQNQMTCLIEIIAMVASQKLQIIFNYSHEQFRMETIIKLADDFLRQLKVLLQHCCAKESGGFTPSDFETVDISQDEIDNIFI